MEALLPLPPGLCSIWRAPAWQLSTLPSLVGRAGRRAVGVSAAATTVAAVIASATSRLAGRSRPPRTHNHPHRLLAAPRRGLQPPPLHRPPCQWSIQADAASLLCCSPASPSRPSYWTRPTRPCCPSRTYAPRAAGPWRTAACTPLLVWIAGRRFTSSALPGRCSRDWWGMRRLPRRCRRILLQGRERGRRPLHLEGTLPTRGHPSQPLPPPSPLPCPPYWESR